MKKNWNKNKLKKSIKYEVLSIMKAIFVLSTLCFLYSCEENNTKQQSDTSTELSVTNPKSAIYYCPMHPEVEQDHPGKCPKPECAGMDLVLKKPADDLESALGSVSSNVLSKIHIISPVYKKFPLKVEALGYIDYDNYSKYNIVSLYSGRIDKLYIRFNYQPIKKGEVVFEIYSPDLVNAQENLLYVLKTSPEEKELIDVARQKLRSLQLTNGQIEEIEKTKKIKQTIPVYSQYDGHVHEMADSKAQGMNADDFQKSSTLDIKEGMYIERGKVLFNVVNAYKALVMLKVKASDISKIRLGQRVDFFINSDSSMLMHGKVDFIEPVFNSNAKTMLIRVNLNNEGHKHKIGSFINATIIADSLETLWVPKSAIVDLGKSKIVWLQKDGSFKAVEVETGASTMDMVEIADGLTETSKIAMEAHYLSDSEGFIKIEKNE